MSPNCQDSSDQLYHQTVKKAITNCITKLSGKLSVIESPNFQDSSHQLYHQTFRKAITNCITKLKGKLLPMCHQTARKAITNGVTELPGKPSTMSPKCQGERGLPGHPAGRPQEEGQAEHSSWHCAQVLTVHTKYSKDQMYCTLWCVKIVNQRVLKTYKHFCCYLVYILRIICRD